MLREMAQAQWEPAAPESPMTIPLLVEKMARGCRMTIARLLERIPRFLRVLSPLARPGRST